MEWIRFIGDGIAICMCALTVMLLIRQQLRYRPKSSSLGSGKAFKQHLNRWVNDPPEIAESQAVYETSEGPPPPFEHPTGNGKDNSRPGRVSDHEAAQDHESAVYDDNPYNQVRKLAGMGIEKEEIVKRVALPKGEIELILKLNRLNPDFKEM